MGEVGCLKDGNFQNLQCESTTILDVGNVTLTGQLILPGGTVAPTKAIPVKLKHSVVNDEDQLRHPLVTVNSKVIAGYHIPNCEHLFNYLAGKDSLTAEEATELFQATATASTTCTLAQAVADAANTPGFDATLKIQFLTGDWSATADIGNVNPLFDALDNRQQLIVFGGNTSSGTGVITFSLTGSDKFDDSGTSIAVSGSGDGIMAAVGAAGTDDDSVDITLTPQNGTKIEKGSWIYIENLGGNAVMARGYFRVSGGTLTAAIPD